MTEAALTPEEAMATIEHLRQEIAVLERRIEELLAEIREREGEDG